MPHLILEYPQDYVTDAQIESLLDTVHRAALQSGLFDESHIRVRAIPLDHYRSGGKRKPFIHVQCRIHGGRTDDQKRLFSEAVLVAIRDHDLPVAVITVEVVEMDRASYAKYVLE